jgi:ABC-type branched-subunit amino acid transport system ATPase component
VNAAPPLLDVAGLTVRFGGLAAVENVSLSVGDAGITGLIGPNGAGKTTTFNACSGFIRGSAGTITFAGEDITTASPAARARRGIGRTFQRMELFESLSVRDNVALGREASLVGSSKSSRDAPNGSKRSVPPNVRSTCAASATWPKGVRQSFRPGNDGWSSWHA